MELFLPDQIALDRVSKALMSAIDETARRVKEHRPLSPDVIRRIQDDLLPERVQKSNAVEGNTLDLRETKMILETGHLIASKRREALEARNLGEAVRALSDVGADDMSIHTRERLLDVHRMVLRDINAEWAGRFREHAVKIGGAKWKPPNHGVLPALVDRMLERLAQEGDESPLLMGVWAHWAFAAIHPFSDGNGRTARLWQDLVFYQRGLTCASIHAEERCLYFEALQHADDGDFNPLVQLIGQRTLNTFDLYEKAAQEDVAITQWARKLVGDVDESALLERNLEYQRWVRRMEQLREAFHMCATRVSKASDAIDVRVVTATTPNYDAYERDRLGFDAGAKFFELHIRRASMRIVVFAQFESGRCAGSGDEDARSEERVLLRMRPNHKRQVTQLVSVFVVDDAFVRESLRAGRSEYDRPSATQIAMDCIEDLVRALEP